MPAMPQLTVTDAFGALDDVDVLVFLVSAPDAHTGRARLRSAGTAADLIAAYGIDLDVMFDQLELTGTAGAISTVPVPPLVGDDRWSQLPTTLMFAGVGQLDPTSEDARHAGAAIARAVRANATVAVADFVDLPASISAAFTEGALLASYRHPFTGSGEAPAAPAAHIRLVDGDAHGLDRGVASAQVTVAARTWAATPASVKSPQWFADQARQAARALPDVTVRVHDEAWIREHRMGGLAAVGHGSASPPRFVVIEYTPAATAPGTIALVGKGITYDTGGISIKPREAMIPMKTDMSGAAAVLAAVIGAAEAQLSTSVVGVLPMAENAVGAGSYRPGDVVTIADGTTVEIGNTDAEGRLVLADAMAWARQQYQPSLLVDVATLTGAATLGLGKQYGALYATTTKLARALQAAGSATGEPLWRMPLTSEYRASLDSPVADLCHISRDRHTGGGSITAALFLHHFAADSTWAHLDIAGPGRAARSSGIFAEGATGFGARTLLRFLSDYDASAADGDEETITDR